jgi:type II secretory pathway pseudopilin PulG
MIAGSAGLRRFSSRRRAFTYIESMMALAILSLAGTALLTSVIAAVGASNDSVYRSIGTGLAEQLLDEIAAAKFPSGSPSTLGTSPCRDSFATIDDYSGWTESPPRTKACEVLGTDNGASVADAYANLMTGMPTSRAAELQTAPGFVNRFTRSVLVERLKPGTNGWTVETQHTSHRRVTVTVSYTASNQPARTVAQVSRVFSYVPSTP